ncbi:hypothetical protein QVD17_26392 [Tagetes erecta]|uniref:Uncharacterized protein n=1 Tax=Tagetes erecta TaxID=13708 RepID=A0AAD8KAW8_TARER|nr:hypothetical protein QVD17_26392 [Tagetes erecta]
MRIKTNQKLKLILVIHFYPLLFSFLKATYHAIRLERCVVYVKRIITTSTILLIINKALILLLLLLPCLQKILPATCNNQSNSHLRSKRTFRIQTKRY